MTGKMTKAVKKVGDRIIHSEFVPEIPHKYLINNGWIIQDIPESIIELKEGISKIDFEKIPPMSPVDPPSEGKVEMPKRTRRTNAQILADQNKK